MYLVPKINLFHALKLGPQSKESANFFNKVWDQDSRFVPQVSRLIQRQGSCAFFSPPVKSVVIFNGFPFKSLGGTVRPSMQFPWQCSTLFLPSPLQYVRHPIQFPISTHLSSRTCRRALQGGQIKEICKSQDSQGCK